MGKEVCSGPTFVIEKPGGAFGAASVTEERIKHEGTKALRCGARPAEVASGKVRVKSYHRAAGQWDSGLVWMGVGILAGPSGEVMASLPCLGMRMQKPEKAQRARVRSASGVRV